MKGARLIAGLPVLVLACALVGVSQSLADAVRRLAHKIAGLPCRDA